MSFVELVTDILKEVLVQKAEMTAEQVNELIIRKTLGGPKRFRPLSREEMENKIAELERKAKKAQATAGATPKALAVPPAIKPTVPTFTSQSTASTSAGVPEMMTKIGELQAQVNDLERILQAKDEVLLQAKGDLVRLRARNAELTAMELQFDAESRLITELRGNYEKLVEEHAGKSQRCMELEEELLFVKDEVLMENETQAQLVEALQDRTMKLTKQNTSECTLMLPHSIAMLLMIMLG